jgi:hypothetical protein
MAMLSSLSVNRPASRDCTWPLAHGRRSPRSPGTQEGCSNAASIFATRRSWQSTRAWTRGPHAVGPAQGVCSHAATTASTTVAATLR